MLSSLSARELKAFVTCRVKLQLRLDKGQDNIGFAAKGFGIVPVPGPCRLILLPGGKFLLAIGYFGQLALHRIELDNGRVSLPVMTSTQLGRCIVWKVQLPITTSSSPMLVLNPGKTSPLPPHLLVLPSFLDGPSALPILRIDCHNGLMSEECTLELPENFLFSRVDGRGRVIGFLVYSGTSVRLIVIHLDHPNVTLESEFTSSHVSNVHFFRVLAARIMWDSRPIEGTFAFLPTA